jgi:hypothetical protein
MRSKSFRGDNGRENADLKARQGGEGTSTKDPRQQREGEGRHGEAGVVLVERIFDLSLEHDKN